MEKAVFAVGILTVAILSIWAIWGNVPWKTIGKIFLTLIIIWATISLLNNMN